MVRAFVTDAREYDWQGAEFNGIAVINKAGAVVKNMKVNGDLIIAAGVGEGEVQLENVDVSGSVYVDGGGEHSVYFNGCNISELVVTKTLVRVVLENGSVVEIAVGQGSDGIFELGSGTTVGTLTIIGEGMTINMEGGASVGTLNADAGGTSVQMAGGTSIGTANLNGQTQIAGTGSIGTANVNVNGCVTEPKPGTVNAKDGVTTQVGGQPYPPAQAPSGGGGGSGNGGGTTPPTFTSHSAPDKPDVPYGTPFADLDLPAAVTLYATDGASCTADVAWDDSGYVPTQVGAEPARIRLLSMTNSAQ